MKTMNSTPHLIACVCCGKRWIDTLKIGVACPWCESSCKSLKPLTEDTIETLKLSGIPDIRN